MAPPPLRQFASTSAMSARQVTEDTPADLLEGSMDLTVILPAGHRVNMSVHRSTPMMDLLIQVTTAHKINPGGHVIHVVSDNRLLSYKPSTPIGTLDTSVIEIVAKNKVNEEARKRRAHLVTQAIEKNIRLKVNLPRSQLAVYRLPPKTFISDVLAMVCRDRCLDPHTHEIRHPVNVDEKLRESCTLADYQLQEVSVVPRDYHAPPLSVTDLITMAAISQPQDTKRRGLLSLFSRKTKSSTGDSSVSSGSAGERSVSPARSDESADGRPTPRPLSLASSSATLTSTQPQLSRPASVINLAKNRKRQAPAPPPPPSASTPTPAPAPHTNGKEEGERGEGGDTSLSRRSSDSSGYHEADQRSPYTSPAGSEISSAEAARTAQVPQATNLTSVVSTSSLSLSSSRGKRKAPPPPKPPPTRQDEASRPSAIPEESESPAPTKSSSKEDISIANGEAHHDPPQQHQPDNQPSSPTSSHVSSVSSLSSVEQHQANHPRLPPPPDIDSPPAPPSSERTNLGATPSNSPQPTSATHFSSNMTPSHQSYSNTYKPLSPTDARITVAAGVTFGMHHDAATAFSLSHTTDSSKLNGTESGIVSPDRLAKSEALQHHVNTDHPSHTQAAHHGSSHELPSTSSVRSREKQKPSTEIIQERNYLGAIQDEKSKESHPGFSSHGVTCSAKIDFNPNDAVVPENDIESIPDIPTFRIVTKSNTALQKEEDVGKKFIADGKTQKVSEENKFGSKSKSAKNSSMNPLARGQRLVKQNNIAYDDDDLDVNEDMFEPRNVFGISMTSVDLSVEGSPVTDQNKHALSLAGYQHRSSTPVKIAAPVPTRRRNTPEPPSHSVSTSQPINSVTDQHTSLVLSSIANEEKHPKPVPRTQIPQKKKAPPPPVAEQIAEVSTSTRQVIPHKEELQASHDESSSFALKANCMTSCDISQSSHVLESKEIEKIVQETQETPDEEFKVHFSELSKVDYDMLSLLSEEGIDSISVSPQCRSPRSSITSTKSDSSRDNEDAPVVPAQNDETVKASNSSSTTSSHISPTTSSPVPPMAALPAQTTASSYRAGYLAMMAELKSWKDSDSLHNVGLESDSDSCNPRDSIQELPKVMGSLQETLEDPAQISQVSCEGGHRGSSLRPRLVSSSSLCSDTDHEVQTRTASFSSETSEENVTSGRVKPNNTPIEDNLPGEECFVNIQKINEKEFIKNLLKEAEIISEQNNASDEQSTTSRRKTDNSSISNSEDNCQSDVQQKITVLTRKLEFSKEFDAPLLRKNVCSQPQEKSNFTDSTVVRNTSLQSVSSLSVADSEGDDGGNITQRLTGECEKREVVNTEVFELPRSTIKTSTGGRTVHESSDDTSLKLINDKNTRVSSGSRKSSVSSSSSASNESSTNTSHIELTPQVSQEVTKKKIESHLLAAFAELKDENKLSELPSEEPPMQSSVKMLGDLPLPSSDNNWDYKLPDPPTPFKDGPSSRVADDSSSTSSEPAPEILTDVPSGFKDSSGSSLSESTNVNIIERASLLKQMQGTKETNNLVSNASSRKSSSSSLSSTSYKSEEKAKQNVINELKSTIKETNNNEPRIVELKPKFKGMETILQTLKSPSKEATSSTAKIQAKDIVTQEMILPAKPTVPVQHTYVPQVVAKGPVESKKSHVLDNPPKINKSSNSAIFGYESYCNSPEPEVASLHSRSGSSTSHESAPPPAPPLSDLEFEARTSRSSSDVSDGKTRSTKSRVARQNSGSGNETGKSRSGAMNFSISTYTSRSEETSYDKKITKSESFNHQVKPKLGQLSKIDSLSTQPKSDELKEDKRDEATNNETSISSVPSIDLQKPSLPKKPHWSEFSSAPVKHSPFLVKPAHSAKPCLPPNKPTLFGMHSETSLNINQPVARVNSLGDRPAIYRNSRDSHFPAPDPPRPLRRLKRTDNQEHLERTTSLINLATPNYELRKAQSSYDVSYGSGGNDNGGGNGMSGMPGMPGMPGMFGMQSMGGDGMMPHDARLADEFMKLQQDFFKWQQQLLQNQHVLHSRVAPLASNPPQLQSVGVLRDIMSQTPTSANGGPELIEARNPSVEKKGPVERVINIQFEDGPRETDDSQVRTSIPRLNQNVHNITTNMGQLSTNDFGRPSNAQPRRWGEEPSVSVGAWMERPPQSVGVYQDRDYVTSAPRSQSIQDLSSPPVSEERQRTPPRTTFVGPRGYSRPADSVKPETRPYQWTPQQQQDQVTQPLQYQFLPPDQQQQFVQFVQQQQPQQQWQQQQTMQQQQAQPPPPKPQFVQLQQQPQQQPQQPQQQPQQPQQQPLQKQQQLPKPQFVQPQQQPPKLVQPQQQPPKFVQPQPDKTAFWRELEEKRQDLGMQNDQEASEPTRPPRRNSRQESPPQDPEVTRPLTYFGQQAVVHEPPPPYYYNGGNSSVPPNLANVASVTIPKEVEPEVGGPRYTSVVTLSDKNEQPTGAPPVKDKVRSVVQLNNDQRGQPRTAPVVRGFRQPGEEPPNQGGTIHSRIVSNALKTSQPSQPQARSSVSPPSVNGSVPTALSTQVPEAPTSARLVAAVPKAPLPSQAVTRISPPRTSPSRISPPRTSPVRTSPTHTPPSRVSPPSGPAFPVVQLRPVPAGLRASTPPESSSTAPPQLPAAAAVSSAPGNQFSSVPPPPPPAPPMAPPPPPAPKAMSEERRTASGKKIISSKTGPELDAREELMMAIKNHGGMKSLRRTRI